MGTPLIAIHAVFFIALFSVYYLTINGGGGFLLTRAASFRAIYIILLTLSFEYVFLGPFSYISIGDETAGLGLYSAMLAQENGSVFDHYFAGGNNCCVLHDKGMELLSLERTLVSLFPVWIAEGLSQLIVNFIGIAGVYLLCRRQFNQSRALSIAIAVVFVSLSEFGSTPLNTGIGFFGTPLGIYLVITRLGRRYYWGGIIAFSIFYAVSSHIIMTLIQVLLSIILASFVLSRPRWQHVLSCAIIGAMSVANYIDSIWSLAKFAPISVRATIVGQPEEALGLVDLILKKMTNPHFMNIEIAIISVLSIAFLIKMEKFFRYFLICIISIFIGQIMKEIPFSAVGLKFLESYDWDYASYSSLTVFVISLSQLLSQLSQTKLYNRVIPILLIGFGAALLAHTKAANAVDYIGNGGVNTLYSIPNLKNPHWLARQSKMVRSIAYPHYLSRNILPSYGIRSFDGYFNLMPKDRGLFWKYGLVSDINKINFDLSHGQTTIPGDPASTKESHDLYTLEQSVSIDALRLAGVGFVISMVPLTDGRLTKVDGPDDSDIPARSNWKSVDRLKDGIQHIFKPRRAFIYSVPEPLPMAYVARSVQFAQSDKSEYNFYKFVLSNALDHIAVLRGSNGDHGFIGDKTHSGDVDLSEVLDGYDFTINSAESADGALVIVNTPFVPFWRAIDENGNSLSVVSVNGIHTGVILSSGRSVRLRYEFRVPSRTLLRFANQL